ncbi:MAG: rhodanese-related sulfurtransferase [Paraglaciecola sp.]|jgi:rhodanese-related sulfurtransferase
MDINVTELKAKLDAKEDFIFIDVREPHEYEEFNLNAKLIPLGNIMAIIEGYADQKDKEIVIHCRSGARSGQAQQFMQMSGYTNVRNLTGGVLEWQRQFG